jgi:hypothetical protein
MLVDETYANGDGTDSWCSTNKLVPNALFEYEKYLEPSCSGLSCFTIYFASALPSPYLYQYVGGACIKIGSDNPLPFFFLCM